MRYVEAFPDQLDEAWQRGACAVLPIGALEWHGSHLPLGLDGLLAEEFSFRLATRIEGVLLPIFYTPVTTLPHKHSLQVSTQAFRLLIDETLAGLHRSGARRMAIVTGHYAQGHEIELFEAALRAIEDLDDCLVFAATPLEPLARPELLDHAARYETSQLLSVAPELVNLDALPATVEAKTHAVLGSHPREASPEEGTALLGAAEDAWVAWLDSDADSLRNHYRSRFDQYQGYVDAFYEGSWEEAIEKWWQSKE